MKTTFYVPTLIAVLFSCIAFSQSPLPVGKSQLNLGIGLSEDGVPVYAGIDYSIHKDITIGGELSYRSYYENWNHHDYHHYVTGISGNGNYHFNSLLKIQRRWDLYAGLNLGFYIWSSPEHYPGDQSSGVGLGLQVGTRYYVSKKVGLNLEFGGGNEFSGGKFGVSIKL